MESSKSMKERNVMIKIPMAMTDAICFVNKNLDINVQACPQFVVLNVVMGLILVQKFVMMGIMIVWTAAQVIAKC